MTRSQLLSTLCLIISSSLFSQEHADCNTALEICNKQPLHIFSDTEGIDPTELNSAACFSNGTPGNYENNTYWIRFTVAQSGSLWFILRPDNPPDDLDFAVFRLNTGNCDNKELVRCMAAGDITFPSPCMGPTGLLPGQIDVSVPAGCTTVDNFLAPLDLQTGETYVLAINNFTSSMDSFTVEFCGTALLGCETEICSTLKSNEKSALQTVNIYPNPVLQQQAWLELQLTDPAEITMTLFNTLGVPLQVNNLKVPAGQYLQWLDLSGVASGVYMLTLHDGMAIQSFVIQVLNRL